jgi:5-methylcytosine-specific restriction protein A
MTRTPWANKTKRQTSSRPWSRLRDAVFLRDKYQCQDCGRLGSPSELECDHRIPLAKGGTDDMSNLQTLCGGKDGCHAKKTITETGGKTKKATGADGWPME